MRGLTMLFPPKPAAERDAHIISQSDFIVAVQPADEQTMALLGKAEVAGRRVIYIEGTSRRRIASAARSVPMQPPSPAGTAVAERARRSGVPSQQARSAAAKPAPEARFMAAGATILPRVRDTSVHVGVITGGSSIKKEQAAALASHLAKIPVPKDGKLILHHGCASAADAAAHEAVQTIKGWEIHGHPVSGSPGGQPPTSMLRQLHAVHETKPRDERDADIVRASTIVIFVEPRPPGAKVLRAAVSAGGTIINVPPPAPKKKAATVPAPARKKTVGMPAPTEKKVTSVPAPAGKKRKREAQPNRRTRNMGSYGPYEAREARIAELLRKVNQPESLVDAWR